MSRVGRYFLSSCCSLVFKPRDIFQLLALFSVLNYIFIILSDDLFVLNFLFFSQGKGKIQKKETSCIIMFFPYIFIISSLSGPIRNLEPSAGVGFVGIFSVFMQ